MDDKEHYIKLVKELQRKLDIAEDALSAIEIVTDMVERNINDQPLEPIVRHNFKVCKEALEKIRGN